MELVSFDMLELMASLPLIKIINRNRYGVVTEYEEDHFGRKQGRFTEKDHRGNLISEAHYKDDMLHGTKIYWDYDYMAHKRNGFSENDPVPAIMRECANYTEGVLDGLYEKFYYNGAPHKRMTYKSGTLTGRIQVWDEDGNVSQDWEYPLDIPF